MAVPKRKAFGRSDDYKMLEMIENNPVLYDWAHDLAKDSAHRDKIWKQIAADLGKPENICKKRWKSIRDSYMRFRRRLTQYPSTAYKCLNWHFWPKVQFLNICLDPNKYHGSAEALVEDETSDATQIIFSGECDEEEGSEIVEEIIEITPDPEKSSYIVSDPLSASKQTNSKRCLKRKHLRKSIKESYYSDAEGDHEQDGDALDAFFTSMALSVKKLPAHLIIKARMDICNLVSKYELEAMDLPRAPPRFVRSKKGKIPKATVKCELLEAEDSSDGEY